MRLLSLVYVFSVISSFRNESIQDEGGFGECEGVDVLEFAQVECRGCFFVASRWRLGARSSWMIRHGGKLKHKRCFLVIVERSGA